ncbi:hypothetical protein B1L11_19905 [Microbispora sp. GKU 823]|nr:hypothetical protein B1L11_19905 [Microbispora sp. GKU 823]
MSIVPRPPLVGRATELRTLIDAVTRPPAVVLVEGEAGIGKTRLVRAALDRLPTGDRAVLLGYCHQIREPFPYGPVFEALRDIRGRLPAAHRLNPVTGALRGHLPELAGALRRRRSPWTTRGPSATGCSARYAPCWRPSDRPCSSSRTCTGPTTARSTCCASWPGSRRRGSRWSRRAAGTASPVRRSAGPTGTSRTRPAWSYGWRRWTRRAWPAWPVRCWSAPTCLPGSSHGCTSARRASRSWWRSWSDPCPPRRPARTTRTRSTVPSTVPASRCCCARRWPSGCPACPRRRRERSGRRPCCGSPRRSN